MDSDMITIQPLFFDGIKTTSTNFINCGNMAKIKAQTCMSKKSVPLSARIY
jgi:hypothetical protein